MEHDRSDRQRLGRTIRAARLEAGYRRREDFAEKLGRSARQVQALENGDTGVGPDTWAAAAAVLGWPIERVYEILESGAAVPPSSSTGLADASDEELVAEVLRRMRAGDGDDGDASSNTTVSELSDRRPRVPEKRVARRPEK